MSTLKALNLLKPRCSWDKRTKTVILVPLGFTKRSKFQWRWPYLSFAILRAKADDILIESWKHMTSRNELLKELFRKLNTRV
jgi:hypothetical protein